MAYQNTCPMSRKEVVDTYFLEHRAKLMDIAAFLDRVERAQDDGIEKDFRVAALEAGIKVLVDGEPERVKRVMELMSDPTEEPLESAAGMKGAAGVWPGYEGGE